MTGPGQTISERAVTTVAGLLAGRSQTRRRFLSRTAVVSSALAVNGVDYILRPLPAYGVVTDCGSAAGCGDGWTAFCATISKGSNTCPPGSYVAGWWKVDSSSFCPGPDGSPGTRYYIDCNRSPDASCSAHCSGDSCDGRAVCRNNFRYGQCNQQIRGVTQVVCRVVTCAPPWEYDPTCTTTVRTDNNTATHNSPYLAPRNASPIRLRWQDLGQNGSPLGPQTMAERAAAGDGRIAGYAKGFLVYSAATGVHEVLGAIANRYEAMGLTESALGYPTTGDRAVGDGVGRFTRFTGGAIYWTAQNSAHEVTRGIFARYRDEGGPGGFLGYPVSYERAAPAGRRRSDFAGGWSIVWDPASDETRILPDDVEMPADGSWPAQVQVTRWSGPLREDTAAAVAAQAFAPGVPAVYIARADAFADALSGGVAAGIVGGPLLLTHTQELPRATVAQLERLRPSSIVVLGGPRAVSPAVAEQLAAYASEGVTRLDGEDRYATAAAVSRHTFPDGAERCFVATGTAFADAITGGPAAVAAGAPLLLTRPDQIPPATAAEIQRLGVRDVTVLGGEAAIGDVVVNQLRQLASGAVTRRWGANRYATAASIAELTDDAEEVFVVTGSAFPDGLATGPAAASREAPILLTAATDIPPATDGQMRRLRPARVVVIGGEQAVPAAVAKRFSYYVPGA